MGLRGKSVQDEEKKKKKQPLSLGVLSSEREATMLRKGRKEAQQKALVFLLPMLARKLLGFR